SNLSPVEMKALLQASGTKVAIETACDCRVDAASAVERAKASSLTVIPQAITLAPEETVQFSAMGGKGPYTFSASSDSVGQIDEKGLLTAKAEGEMTVSVTDSKGEKNESLKIRVAAPQTQAPEEECPLGDPAMCDMMCVISPDLPWCKN
ncbi:MAG: Ig domain-containing protein, partial [Pseudomonadota bacterium]